MYYAYCSLNPVDSKQLIKTLSNGYVSVSSSQSYQFLFIPDSIRYVNALNDIPIKFFYNTKVLICQIECYC